MSKNKVKDDVFLDLSNIAYLMRPVFKTSLTSGLILLVK